MTSQAMRTHEELLDALELIDTLKALLRRAVDSEKYLVKLLNENDTPCTVGSWVEECERVVKK